jgi:hypothetical protein
MSEGTGSGFVAQLRPLCDAQDVRHASNLVQDARAPLSVAHEHHGEPSG